MRRLEIAVPVFLVTLSAMVAWQAFKLPPGTFESLGSAGFPLIVVAVVAALSAYLLVRALLEGRPAPAKKDPPPAINDPPLAYRPRPDLALGFYALCLVYTGALVLEVPGFAVVTAVFLFVTMGILTKFNRRRLPVVVAIALVIGFGCDALFTRVFGLALP